VKSNARDDKRVKGNRNDADISDEKMENLKTTLRACKEVLVMYKDMSDCCDEANTSNQVTRLHVKESKVHITESPMTSINIGDLPVMLEFKIIYCMS